LVNLGLLRPDIQIQFSTFIKKAVFTELPNWPIAHWSDTGHWALGQCDWVTSVSSSKGCAEGLAWLILLSPHTVGHEQSWDFSAEHLSPRLTQSTSILRKPSHAGLAHKFPLLSELPIFYLDPSANL